eukprot:16166758-Heterocapsa_arctica.AAC.1
MGFQANADKFQVATADKAAQRQLRADLGLKTGSKIKSLGIITDFITDKVIIDGMAYQMCLARMRATGLVSKSIQ